MSKKPQPNAAAPAASKIDLTWASEGQTVWVTLPENDPSGEAFGQGVITKLHDEESCDVKLGPETKTFRGDKIYPLNNYRDFPQGYDDMVDMECLSEAELLNNVRIRANNDMIYTYVGPTLIVLNPYKRIEKLLDPKIIENFQKCLLENKFDQKEQMPHVYAIAASTMKNLFENHRNQAIVISGESGAGKTENTKSAMKFLTSLNSTANAGKKAEEGDSIEDKILACNPVLEAFGNSKTVRNDNSSRFGKYVSLLVNKDNRKIIGATITNYLLEKSRVITQTPDERNYHIFYALIRGASDDTLKRYYVQKDLNFYNYIKGSFKGIVPTVPDDELYKEVNDSFKTMKFSDKEQHAIWSYLSCSLMLGNVDFDESTFGNDTPCKVVNDDILQNVAKLLEVDYAKLSHSLTHKTRFMPTEVIHSTIKRDECLMFRNSLAKELYNKLFNWLVKRLNFTVMPPEFMAKGANVQALTNNYYHIGLLDIFGFEIFKVNSIEQFCINFANERLQQLYIAYIFKGEEQEFVNEGLKDFLCELNFSDNQVLIEMIDSNNSKAPGIFQMIDEACSITCNDHNLYQMIYKQCKKPEMPFSTPKIPVDTFIILHTAKDVEYNINGFRDKNKDEISKTIEDAICASTNSDMSRTWKNLALEEVETLASKSAKPNPKDKFLGYKFRAQMKELMEELYSCECHFIRCIKPNEAKQKDHFVPNLVLQQIQYMGILDTIKVRKDSFPIRTPYNYFFEKYQELDRTLSKTPFEEYVKKGADFKELSKEICQKKVPHLDTKMILFGKNKIFLRVEAGKEIERLRKDWLKMKHIYARRIQKLFFRNMQRRKLNEMRGAVRTVQKKFRLDQEHYHFARVRYCTRRLQKWWRGILIKRRYEKMVKQVCKIQKWWKMKFHSRRYKRIKTAARLINRIWRGAIARKQARGLKVAKYIMAEIVKRGTALLFRKVQVRAAMMIQRNVRGFLARNHMKSEIIRIRKVKEDFIKNKNATIIQKNVRGLTCRSAYRRMKRAAQYIQGFMKMKWLSSLFQRLRHVSVRIQRAVRIWLTRRVVIRERLNEFLASEEKDWSGLQLAEKLNLFGNYEVVEEPSSSCSPLGKVTSYRSPRSYKESIATARQNSKDTVRTNNLENYASGSMGSMGITLGTEGSHRSGKYQFQINTNMNIEGFNSHSEAYKLAPPANTVVGSVCVPKEVDPYAVKKIEVYTKLLDVEVLTDTSIVYDPIWSLQIQKLEKESNKSSADLNLIEVGQAHTTVVPGTGKVFGFGWNDLFQLGKPTRFDSRGELHKCQQVPLPTENFRPKNIAVGDDHNLLLDHHGSLYIWGDNSKGQLGVGNCRNTPDLTVLDFVPSGDSITEVRAKADNSMVLTSSGKVYYWPVKLPSGEKIYKPAELGLPYRIQIATTACGYNFAALVAKNGLVFTFGQDNGAGQQGHGDTLARSAPTVVEALREAGEGIVSISCGYKHVICKSAVGNIYTWGWGEKGQLGVGDFKNKHSPVYVDVGTKVSKAKIMQVVAGFKHSMVLLDNKKVLWWGSNNTIHDQEIPVELDLRKQLAGYNKEFTPLKLMCSWSKTMSITYVTVADTRASEENTHLKYKVLSTLVNRIEELNAFQNLDIPYIDSISKHFSVRSMGNRHLVNKLGKPGMARSSSPEKEPAKMNLESLTTLRNTYRSKEGEDSPLSKKLLESARAAQSTAKYDTAESGRKAELTGSEKKKSTKVQGSASKSSKAKEEEHQISPKSLVSPQKKIKKASTSTEKNVKALDIKSLSSEKKAKTLENKKSGSPKKKAAKKEDEEEMDLDVEQVDELSDKLTEIKKKMQVIMATPIDQWSINDEEFIKIATDPKMLNILKNIK